MAIKHRDFSNYPLSFSRYRGLQRIVPPKRACLPSEPSLGYNVVTPPPLCPLDSANRETSASLAAIICRADLWTDQWHKNCSKLEAYLAAMAMAMCHRSTKAILLLANECNASAKISKRMNSSSVWTLARLRSRLNVVGAQADPLVHQRVNLFQLTCVQTAVIAHPEQGHQQRGTYPLSVGTQR